MRYDPAKIEKKWQKRWLKNKIYEPDFTPRQARGKTRRKFYNLMMFPYPSAEGLHIGSVRTFSGIDIYGRFKRMQGHDVFEPIGLDGFGIHSENYALKIGKHPFEHAKDSEKNFYRQLGMIGNSFAWEEKLETYDPKYYKWTQWIFTQMFKRGLAYRKKSPVNWCPSCKTVLADEQVLQGECERCQTEVIKKDLEQWFFKITDYAERLLKNLDNLPDRQAGIDWPEPIKIAQRNWIGKSEGAEIDFETRTKEKPNFVLLHGYGGSPEKDFFPWLKKELGGRGYRVQVPRLPHSDKSMASEKNDMRALFQEVKFDRDTVLLGHSLGAIIALKALEKLGHPIRKLILVGGFLEPKFRDHDRAFANTFSWKFDFNKIKRNADSISILHDANDHAIPYDQGGKLLKALGGKLFEPEPMKSHFNGDKEPAVLNQVLDKVKVFTTRPDTLFGATYMVVAPEHALVTSNQLPVTNRKEVDDYIKKAKAKTDEERIAEGKDPSTGSGRDKTGVELKGIKAINPANGEEIPIWVADYVLGNVGTGAIMAVPAHDERDFEFAKKYNLPMKMVVCSHYPEKTCPVLDRAYVGPGHLVDSGKFSGMHFEKAKWEITKFVDGEQKTKYRLRDWLISRQRYWGPPIPLVFCENCATRIKNQESRIKEKFTRGELENVGWIAIPEKDLPVRLPYIKDFRPTGTDKSPLATVEKFYKVRCPKCRSWARRETDVSDTFLDSAWYYIGYLAKENSKFEIRDSRFRSIAKRWLPVDMYIGGAEHAVLHLLYVRFLAMVFSDLGLIHFEEPFKKFRTHGLITKDGAKMSKSKGNVVNPDEYIKAYGSDAIRMYLAFLAPLTHGGDFRDDGIKGLTRFLERVWKLATSDKRQATSPDVNLTRLVHRAIKKVTEDIETLQYNTAISALMILLNEFEKNGDAVSQEDTKIFLKLLAPFAPFIAEELWHSFATSYPPASPDGSASGGRGKLQATSIHMESWPKYDLKFIKEETFELVIQVNGKVRGRVTLPVGVVEEEAKKAALAEPSVGQHMSAEPRKVIFVPNKLINFVV